ncbi:ArsI/CadI family heavy metal resistance metalloenzyme [Roseivirga sp. BDSF3-8]|uniref:ArsI/CadI family heavy metal resistance metalloenzyme n=1 Tax=Roseivirga sp. BDSF3-8 TaxID=3241598 RepID=UPI0035324AE9
MKRLHINVHVKNIERSVAFYSTLFDAQPSVVKHDYAKWESEHPLVNFSISLSDTQEGINHLGIEADSDEALYALYNRLEKLEGKKHEEGDTVCCYAKSHKQWIADPQGVEWEIFHTYGSSDTYSKKESKQTCCIPAN